MPNGSVFSVCFLASNANFFIIKINYDYWYWNYCIDLLFIKSSSDISLFSQIHLLRYTPTISWKKHSIFQNGYHALFRRRNKRRNVLVRVRNNEVVTFKMSALFATHVDLRMWRISCMNFIIVIIFLYYAPFRHDRRLSFTPVTL